MKYLIFFIIIALFNIWLFFRKEIYKYYDYHKVRRKLKKGFKYKEKSKFGLAVQDYVLNEHMINVKNKFEKKYNVITNIESSIGQEENDFTQDLLTLLITLSYKKDAN